MMTTRQGCGLSLPRRVQGFVFRDGTIRRIDLESRRFGSVRRDDFGPASDVDVLGEFEPGHIPGWSIIALENERLVPTSPLHQTAQIQR